MSSLLISLALISSTLSSPLSEIPQFEMQEPTITRIYLVRHGQSAFNVPDENGVLYTSGKGIDVPLTDIGRQQATRLGGNLIGKLPPTDYIILSSTALRAQDTADLIFNELKPFYSIERGDSFEEFCELYKGIWEGKPKDEAHDIVANEWQVLSAKDKFSTPVMSTGESYDEVGLRFLAGLKKVTDLYKDKTIILAAHNAAINALCLHLNGHLDQLSEEPGTPLPVTRLNNSDIIIIEFVDGNPVESAKVTLHVISEK